MCTYTVRTSTCTHEHGSVKRTDTNSGHCTSSNVRWENPSSAGLLLSYDVPCTNP